MAKRKRSNGAARVKKRRKRMAPVSRKLRAMSGKSSSFFRVPAVSRAIIPKSKVVKMPYVDMYTVNATTSSTWTPYVSLTMNSIFDPDFTSIGHQPLGHDQWKAMYKSYEVLGCKVTIEVVNVQQNAANASCYFGFMLSRQTTAPVLGNGYTQLREQPNVHLKYCMADQSNKESTFRYKRFVNVRKWLTRQGDYVRQDQTALFENNPLHLIYLHIGNLNNNPAPAAAGIRFSFKLEYTVLLTNPLKNMSQS